VAFAVQAQVLFTFDFTGTDPAGDAKTPLADHLTVNPFTRANVNAASQTDVFASSHWTQGTTRDPREYVSFSFQPEEDYELDLASLSWTASRTSTGPQSGLVEVLRNGTTVALTPEFAIGTVAASKRLDLPELTGNGTDRFECRFYGWNASSTGNLRLDNVAVQGSVLAIPEPKTSALAAVAGLAAFVLHRHIRRRHTA
jgi:MYXO-CTERM domain-containing protein